MFGDKKESCNNSRLEGKVATPTFTMVSADILSGDTEFKGKGQSVDALRGPIQIRKTRPSSVEKLARKRAMENQDILGEIFNVIGFILDKSGSQASKARTHLFYAVGTCRSFLHPALDVLWRLLPSVFPLLKLLPSFQLVNGEYILSDIKAEEWRILESYARRVRFIRIEFAYLRWKVSPQVYSRINEWIGSFALSKSQGALHPTRC